MSSAPLSAGTQVGRYEVLGHLATGGMGEVYLARRVGIGGFEHLVVLKVMLAHLARDERFAAMFVDEARIASRLSHPHVVQVFDLDRSNGILYLAMEHLDGQSLASCLRRSAERESHVPVEVAARILCDASTGLAFAHAASDGAGAPLGLVHRDISPENLFVTYAGPTKVLDFGVAKVRGKLVQTQQGEFKGKVAYMAPEIISGEPADARSDLFSLGVVMFELLTTRRLFHASNPATTLHRVLSEPIPEVSALRPEVPGELAELCHGLLERDPARRVPTADEVAERLERFCAARGASSKSAGAWLSAAFDDARRVTGRIKEAVIRTGRIDPDDLSEARRLGGAKLDDSAIRELSAEEREGAAARSRSPSPRLRRSSGPRALAEPGVSTTGAQEVSEAEDGADARWIARASLGRWALGALLVAVLGAGGYGLARYGLDADRRWLPAEGEVVDGRYVVAAGGGAARSGLLRATDRVANGAPVSLWISERAPGRADELYAAIREGADRIAKAASPSLPAVLSGGRLGDRVYLVLPPIEARTLEDILARDAGTPKRARQLALGLVAAVVAAERHGLVHGALEPKAVWVQAEDHVVLTGFEMGFVRSGTALGSRYRAPEVGSRTPRATAKADQYALAEVTKELLREWDREGAIAAAPVLTRATLVEPEDRYASIERFERELVAALAGKRGAAARRAP